MNENVCLDGAKIEMHSMSFLRLRLLPSMLSEAASKPLPRPVLNLRRLQGLNHLKLRIIMAPAQKGLVSEHI